MSYLYYRHPGFPLQSSLDLTSRRGQSIFSSHVSGQQLWPHHLLPPSRLSPPFSTPPSSSLAVHSSCAAPAAPSTTYGTAISTARLPVPNSDHWHAGLLQLEARYCLRVLNALPDLPCLCSSLWRLLLPHSQVCSW